MMNSALLAILISDLAFGATLLRVRPHVVAAAGSEVRLIDVIDAAELSADSRTRLEKITLTRAPAFGERQELSSASVMEPLKRVLQAERARGTKIQLVLPKSITVDTVKREVDADQVTRELMQTWQPLCQDCQLELEGLSLPKVPGLRDWSLKLTVELPRGSFSVPVELIRENGQPFSAWISGRLIIKRKVPVAKRMLQIGERVQPQDITWEYRNTAFAVDSVPAETDLAGKMVRQGLRAGEILFSGMLEKEKIIRRGDIVQLRSGQSDWEVSISVVAQQDGVIGDIVNVKNPKTGTSFMGQVVSQGEVELR